MDGSFIFLFVSSSAVPYLLSFSYTLSFPGFCLSRLMVDLPGHIALAGLLRDSWSFGTADMGVACQHIFLRYSTSSLQITTGDVNSTKLGIDPVLLHFNGDMIIS